jgi:RNA polymerase sigma-70 factor (ECF subfamily)
MHVEAAIESFVRESYGQALAWLASRAQGDIAAAEDALSDGLLAALRQWPQDGVPQEPVAWLIQAARRRLIDAQRREATRSKHTDQLRVMLEDPAPPALADERLSLLFACTHPAVDEAARAPLMMQVVLGLDAERIASAYVVAPATMSQRLVRAKARIKDAGIRFTVPEVEHWPERMEFVLAAIYAAYTLGRADSPRDLTTEAISLARVLVTLVPEEPEARGLLALCLHCEARTAAQWQGGLYTPLPEQDTQLWNAELQAEAEHHLSLAAKAQRLGRYQLEAAIQSVHAARRVTGDTRWPAIAGLYQGLLTLTSALGAQIGHAIAHGQVHGPGTGLSLLETIPLTAVEAHQPWWAAKAEFLAQLGRADEAREAYQRAIGLSDSAGIREFLQRRSC